MQMQDGHETKELKVLTKQNKMNVNLIMNNKKSNIKMSEAQAKQFFDEGYKLAFQTKGRIKPWEKIFHLWKSAATAGHVSAQFHVGTCYDFGKGVDKNIKKAFYWYMKAARKGKMEAQYNIGLFYRKGILVKQDYKKAVYWYSLAAKQGDIWAQRDLGYCYFYGEGVKEDQIKAVYWYKKAADEGDGKANYNLGLCYEYGDGVKQSISRAKHYYTKASKLGHRKASNKLKQLNDRSYLILNKYRDTVATNSAKARNYIRQLDYKNNFYLLMCIAQTYLDESHFGDNGRNRIDERKWRMAEKYIIKAYKLSPENAETLYTMGSIRGCHTDQILIAIGCYEDVIKLGETKIAKQEYSRGIEFARELVNDAKFELYRLYYDYNKPKLSKKYLAAYKKGLEKGITTIYTPLEKFLLE